MKIESGKFYKTRDGRKVGPMNVPPKADYWIADIVADCGDEENGYRGWYAEGKYDSGARTMDDDLIAEWTDNPDLSNPLGQVFGLMPPETQEAMKAHGGPWEVFSYGRWGFWGGAKYEWSYDRAYRVKPAPIRETVTLYVEGGSKWVGDREKWRNDTHRITFDLIDGKPDLSSIRMEEL